MTKYILTWFLLLTACDYDYSDFENSYSKEIKILQLPCNEQFVELSVAGHDKWIITIPMEENHTPLEYKVKSINRHSVIIIKECRK